MTHSVVVGGAGFVGSWVVEEILKDPQSKVTIMDNLISSERWNISTNPRVSFIEGSAAEFGTFEKIEAPIDIIYQLACFHGNQSSIARPFDDLENGLKPTLTTLEWVKNNTPKTRVVYSGAGCAVAEKTWESPKAIEEIDLTSLLHDSPYSISKITGEMYCLFYAQHYKLDVVRVRFQNVYGPREILGAGQWRGTENTIWRNVIPTFIYKALNNMDLEIFANSNASRDFIYVEDVAKGVLKAAQFGLTSKVYNIASGNETMIQALATLILEMTNSEAKIVTREKRNWDNSGRRFGSTKLSEQELSFKAKTNLREGIDSTIKWTELNMPKIKESISKFAIEDLLN